MWLRSLGLKPDAVAIVLAHALRDRRGADAARTGVRVHEAAILDAWQQDMRPGEDGRAVNGYIHSHIEY